LRTYLVRRILATIPVMGVVAVIVFLLLHLAPGDPATLIAGDFATAEDIARIGKQLGLDQPLHKQFVVWVGQVLQGELGTSIFSNLPVSRLIRQRLEPTVMLSVTTLVIAVVLAVPVGVLAAWLARTWVDRAVMGLAVCGLSIPVFVLGYLLIYFFAIRLGWLPVQGYVSLAQGLGPCLRSIVLPSMALGSIYMALIARITRASLLEVLEEDYVRTAHAKGLSTLTVVVTHALRNA
jgi:peptide/nickel transport system permease protein